MRLFILSLFVFVSLSLNAQDFSKLKQIPLTNEEECQSAEDKVIECSEYLFSIPCEENLTTLNITQFLLKWMGATPEYSFGFETNFNKAIKSDMALVARYLGAMCLYAIENGHKVADKELQLESIKIVLDYSGDEKNAVNVSKKLKKFMDANEAGTLVDLIVGS